MILGGCPYPNIKAHRIPYLIKDNYRMPKPVHIDEEMWVESFIDVVIYEDIDHRSYAHNLSSCEIKAWVMCIWKIIYSSNIWSFKWSFFFFSHSLLHLFWNHWLSLQSDWLSAKRFIPKSHYFLLQIASLCQPMRMGQ